jgi:peptide/nickel transport system permease protein
MATAWHRNHRGSPWGEALCDKGKSVSEAISLEQGVKVAQPVAAGRSLQAMAWRQLWRKRTALVGMGIIVVLVLTAILADVLAPYEPTATGSGVPMSLPNWQHPLGTDMLGRDMLSRVVHGSRVALYVGVLSLVLPLCAGIPLGVISGFYGGALDNVIMVSPQ